VTRDKRAADLIRETCALYGVEQSDLFMDDASGRKRRRKPVLVACRRACASALREKLNLDYERISALVGYRCHSSAIYATREKPGRARRTSSVSSF